MNDGAGVDDQTQLLYRHVTVGSVHPHAGGASSPGWHAAFLAEGGCNAEPDLFGCWPPPPHLLRQTGEHGRLAARAADGIRRRSGISSGTVEHSQPKLHWMGPGRVRCLVHKPFHSPIRPASTDGSQPAGPECLFGQIVLQRAHPLRSYGVPMVSALAGELIIGNTVEALRHEKWSHDRSGPPSRRMMIHRRHSTVITPGHANHLRGR